jgi:hypothetical protein
MNGGCEITTKMEGQGLVEYGFVIMLVALVILGALTALGLLTNDLIRAGVDAFP